MKSLFSIVSVGAVLVAGCASQPRAINIESDPPGARVFFSTGINQDIAARGRPSYIGTTPCQWTPEAHHDGSFKVPGIPVYGIFVPPAVVVTAEPPPGGPNFSLHEVFFDGTPFTHADKIPPSIFFDFNREQRSSAAPASSP
jgi:hypothetical protein